MGEFQDVRQQIVLAMPSNSQHDVSSGGFWLLTRSLASFVLRASLKEAETNAGKVYCIRRPPRAKWSRAVFSNCIRPMELRTQYYFRPVDEVTNRDVYDRIGGREQVNDPSEPTLFFRHG